jgi:hypothetical protein
MSIKEVAVLFPLTLKALVRGTYFSSCFNNLRLFCPYISLFFG